ncbi:NAD(P)-binding protein [Aspergillus ellipticus CBS 707.79]|uniref:NAD(P)-binding protein n=1 Tax=Aspergillus ellipticus CBS 707.79 TaxID=1448320 RepID=A0A319D348_9EURO|nr:NAD(P)-binding protein [Aspergillus ellipticus CBS 707.79]
MDTSEMITQIQYRKVHIGTGGYAGCGFELVKMLYQKNATVYVAGRTASKAKKAITAITEEFPTSTGRLEYLFLDLTDLPSIKEAVNIFNSNETRLDVLTNNTGVNTLSRTKYCHGRELNLSNNCFGPFLLSKLLLPTLQRTAASSTPGSVRVTWAASIAAVLFSPTYGMTFDHHGNPKAHSTALANYGQSKAGNILLAVEFARRYGKHGILSVAWNPRNLKTELQRHATSVQKLCTTGWLWPSVYGAYTELYSGWSSDITAESNGSYIVP